MAKVVIALSGWAGSGKDTVAEYLVNRYGFKRLAFADLLKKQVAEQYGIPLKFFYDRDLKDFPLAECPVIPTDTTSTTLQAYWKNELQSGYWTPRALCIAEGALKRAVYPNYWVSKVAEESGDHRRVVISDLRFQSEADTLKALLPGTKIIRVNRLEGSESTDPSERDMDHYKFDYEIENTGSIQELESKLSILIPSLTRDWMIGQVEQEWYYGPRS